MNKADEQGQGIFQVRPKNRQEPELQRQLSRQEAVVAIESTDFDPLPAWYKGESLTEIELAKMEA